jgi:hypothetical protein
MKLTSKGPLTVLLTSYNISTWDQLTGFVKNIPYGRNTNRTDLSLVLVENKGTCSSKHALLKGISDENNIHTKLIVGLYKMTETNTPLIGKVLSNYNMAFIPEAHCYLIIKGVRLDYTSNSASFSKIEKALIEEIEIQSNQVAEYKIELHKTYLKKWIKQNEISSSLDEIWKIREDCIQNIEQNKTGTY